MANDFKIELFAYDLFVNTFSSIDIFCPKRDLAYKDECRKFESYTEIIHVCFYETVYCRAKLFGSIYYKALTNEIIQSLKSLSDCYDYMIQICDRKDLFDQLTVFERLFSTLSFVLSLCLRVHFDSKNNIDVYNQTHLLWVMYFEKFTEKFYEEGGWKELKRVASSYHMLYIFMVIFREPHGNLNEIKEAFVNYQQFQNYPQFHQCKYVSKQWVKFSINNFESYINIPIYYSSSMDGHEANLLVEGLKKLCDPYSRVSNEIFEICMGFKPDEEIKANGSLAVEYNVSEQSEGANFYEFSKDIRDFEDTSRSEGHFINSKVPFNLVENSINLNSHVNSFKGNNARKATSVSSANPLPDHSHNPVPVKTTKVHLETENENLPENKYLDLDQSSENITVSTQKEEFSTENQSSGCIHRLDDTVSKENVSERNEKNPIQKVPLICLKPTNEITNIIDKKTDIGKDIDQILGITKTSTGHQVAVYDKNQNTSLKQISSSNSFKPKNKCENTTHQSTKMSNDNDNLLNKNDDFGLNDFHRMLLVLGDRQGIEYVLSTLGKPTKGMQENVAKIKKRGKKKKKPSCNL